MGVMPGNGNISSGVYTWYCSIISNGNYMYRLVRGICKQLQPYVIYITLADEMYNV